MIFLSLIINYKIIVFMVGLFVMVPIEVQGSPYVEPPIIIAPVAVIFPLWNVFVTEPGKHNAAFPLSTNTISETTILSIKQ